MNNNLIVEKDSRGVVRMTMNRPEVGNAFDAQLIDDMTQALKQLAEENVRVLQLRGSGKHFSAGGDLNWMKDSINLTEQENYEDARKLSELLSTLNHFPAPTIAVVQGAAFGGAVGLISACDIAIGADNSRYSLSEVKIGLIPAVISAYVIQALGTRQARRYFLTAEMFDAERALELELLHELVSLDELDGKAEAVTQQLLGNGPEATAIAKEMIHSVHNQPIDGEFIEHACQEIARVRVSPEGQEGLASFLEKRDPAWKLEL